MFREVGEISEWRSWIWSDGIRRKRAKTEEKDSVKLITKPR